jgi:hypothetical protein
VTEPFRFRNAAVAIPAANIDEYLEVRGAPAVFDMWKARVLLALASFIGGPKLSVTVVGSLDGDARAWLEGFCTIARAAAPPEPALATETNLTILTLPSMYADCAAVQDMLAACAGGTGPDGLFIADAQPNQCGDATHSFASVFSALSSAGYLQLHDGYFSAWSRARSPELQSHAMAETETVAAGLQARMLFIIGHARSGTSALFELLNYHPELLLLYESNSFQPRMRRRFAENFSDRMAKLRPAVRWGFFCSPPLSGPDHPLTVLPALLEHYRIVGEKIALSPRENRFDVCPVSESLKFYTRHFPFSKYIFLARSPFEATEAIHRILPGADLAEILRLYAAYMAGMLQHQSILPTSCVLFMEDFGHLNSAALNHLVGFDMLSDNITLSPDARTTRQTAPAPDWKDLAYELRGANNLYDRTRSMFSTNGYLMRRDVELPVFEAVVANWKATAANAAERAFTAL